MKKILKCNILIIGLLLSFNVNAWGNILRGPMLVVLPKRFNSQVAASTIDQDFKIEGLNGQPSYIPVRLKDLNCFLADDFTPRIEKLTTLITEQLRKEDQAEFAKNLNSLPCDQDKLAYLIDVMIALEEEK